MTVQEYLNRPEAVAREIGRKRTRIEALRRMASRFSPTLSDVRVQTTPDPSRMQEFLAEAADEEAEIALLEEERNRALAEAARMISRLPEEKMEQLMELRYLDRQPWEEIAEALDLSPSHTFRLHKAALEFIQNSESKDPSLRSG